MKTKLKTYQIKILNTDTFQKAQKDFKEDFSDKDTLTKENYINVELTELQDAGHTIIKTQYHPDRSTNNEFEFIIEYTFN